MEETKNEQGFSDDIIYTKVRNKTKSNKVVLSALGGVEIGPGDTVNLKAQFKRSSLVDASQQIAHFISIGALEDLSNVTEAPAAPAAPAEAQEAPKPVNVQDEVQRKIREARNRDILNEVNGSSNITRLEDIMLDPATPPEAKRATKARYMQLRGWIDDNGVLIEGSTDDDNQDIVSIDAWEFKTMRLGV